MEQITTISAAQLAGAIRQTENPDSLPVFVALPDGRFVAVNEVGTVAVETVAGEPARQILLLVTEDTLSISEMSALAASREGGQN